MASATASQSLRGPGVVVHAERLAKVGFYGVYYTPPGHDRGPAVITWGGSEGALGVDVDEAALLASHGIPALAIAYFDEPGLACSLHDIPIGYFLRAVRRLRSQPQVDPNRVWILSGSRGTEAELLVAADWPQLIHGVVAAATTEFVKGPFSGHCQWFGNDAGWTLGGRPIPIGQRIPVGKITASVLLFSGGMDRVGPTNVYSDLIIQGLPHDQAPHEHLNYPAAGHVVLDIPYGTLTTRNLADGGTLAANSAAYISDWPATVRFIENR
jgi:hypothetical protein